MDVAQEEAELDSISRTLPVASLATEPETTVLGKCNSLSEFLDSLHSYSTLKDEKYSQDIRKTDFDVGGGVVPLRCDESDPDNLVLLVVDENIGESLEDISKFLENYSVDIQNNQSNTNESNLDGEIHAESLENIRKNLEHNEDNSDSVQNNQFDAYAYTYSQDSYVASSDCHDDIPDSREVSPSYVLDEDDLDSNGNDEHMENSQQVTSLNIDGEENAAICSKSSESSLVDKTNFSKEADLKSFGPRERFGASSITSDAKCKKRKFYCTVGSCTRSFLHRGTFISHLRTHDESGAMCTICFKKFTNFDALQNHRAEAHQCQTVLTFPCRYCDKRFTHDWARNSHEKWHIKETPWIMCDVCLKGFKTQSELLRHYKCHNEERPFSCRECGLRFKRESQVFKHVKLHFSTNTFVCDICGHEFKDHNLLKTHSRIHNKRVETCPECKAGFGNKIALMRHINKMHSNVLEKYYPRKVQSKITKENVQVKCKVKNELEFH